MTDLKAKQPTLQPSHQCKAMFCTPAKSMSKPSRTPLTVVQPCRPTPLTARTVRCHTSHRKDKRRMGVTKPDTLEVQFERLVLSTTKKRLKERLTPPADDPVKLNLEARLNEATEYKLTHPLENKVQDLELSLETNFYELEEELLKINWNKCNIATQGERCREPIARILQQHYFVPVETCNEECSNFLK